MTHALIVDDDVDSAAMLSELIAMQGLTVATANTLRDARKQLALQTPDLVLLDLRLPDGSGMDLFADPELLANSEVVLVTGHASLETSILALRLGAVDYIVKPITPKQLQGVLSRVTKPAVLKAEVAGLSAELASSGNFGQLWGRSPNMLRVYEQISRVAGTGVTVFITGESGTGKEVVAQTIHDLSRRRKMPFLGVNCGAISPNLIESEIFGHEKGSFTGADRQHQGFFERAAGGTLFLDEITEMPLDLQVKLLRVLETGRFERLGSNRERQVKVRVVSATNADLPAMIREGTFREDLYYRLNTVELTLPPLADRPGDIVPLAEHFLSIGKPLSSTAATALQRHLWPGNVRELRNVIQRAELLATGNRIEVADLNLPRAPAAPRPTPSAGNDPDRARIEEVLARNHGVIAQAANELGLSRQALYRRMDRHGIPRE